MASVGGFDIASLPAPFSLDLDVGVGGDTDRKLILAVESFSDDLLLALQDVDVFFDGGIQGAKLYKGLDGDFLVVLYLTPKLDLDLPDYQAILDFIPHPVRFRTMRSATDAEGWIWQGSSCDTESLCVLMY